MAGKASKVQVTAVISSDTTIKASGGGRVFWITTSNSHATATSAIELDDGGSDVWGIVLADVDGATSVLHTVFDPPLEFVTSIIIDITGGTVTATVGYQ